jgi:hypothetical protein
MLHRYNAGMNESFLVNVIVIDPYLSSEQNRILPEKLINIPAQWRFSTEKKNTCLCIST